MLFRVSVFLIFVASVGAGAVDFGRQIQPILAENCYHCHGTDANDRKGQLRLDTREGAMAGGKSDGAAIVPGKPEDSSMIARVTSTDKDEVMPPSKDHGPLKAEQIVLLKQWITEGANYTKHWAFEAPVQAAVPAGEHPVDAFVSQNLMKLGLNPSPEASAPALARRIYLDVIGLPPTPAQVAEFAAAAAKDMPKAVEQLVDALMQRPDFGEKWARQWLDVSRYSDSNGYEKDLPRQQWAWRDWVINAYNSDMAYDVFLQKQLAGDMVEGATQDDIIPTGFLRNSMTNEEGAIIAEQFRNDEMFDRMDCLGKAIMGLTLQCAQCHTHKFDPISHHEYFGIFAFFNNSYEPTTSLYTDEQRKKIGQIRGSIAKHEEAIRKAHPQWKEEMEAWSQTISAKEVPWETMQPTEMDSVSGLNHPTREPDDSVLTLGHPTTSGDVFVIGEPRLEGATGVRMEALLHLDQPQQGPGRSLYGTWAISEFAVSYQLPNTDAWVDVPLAKATADFEEPADTMEPMWQPGNGVKDKRTRGPAAFMIDKNLETGYRGDRGPGLRNQEGVVVVQFATPLTQPAGTRLRISLEQRHGDAGQGRLNTQLGRAKFSITKANAPEAQKVDYAALLAMKVPSSQRTPKEQTALFHAWAKTLADEPSKKALEVIAAQWKQFPEAENSILHLKQREGSAARVTKLLDRGSWENPKEPVAAHTLAVLHPMKKEAPTRQDFAIWVSSRESTLTARVEVNRLWQGVFGQGLVDSAEDFGTRTPMPEYLNLLDWLSVEFMNQQWSRKKLLRRIFTSRTYRQSAVATPDLLEKDPKNKLLTRGPRFRMEAESIRDTILSVAGLLHTKLGGPSFYPPVPQSVLDYNFVKPTYWIPPTGPERYRRSLYIFRKRSMPDPVLSSFDAPNGDFACACRPRSNTPLSALTSLNETIFVEAAQAFAQRVLREAPGDDAAARIRYAYQLCVSRGPTAAELATTAALLDKHQRRLQSGELRANQIAFSELTRLDSLPSNATPNDLAAWTIVGRVLLNLDETLTKN
jgi:hypothetical protein